MDGHLGDLSCKEAAQLINVAQDRILSFEEAESLRQHLDICTNCQLHREQMSFLRKFSQMYAEFDAGALSARPDQGPTEAG